MLKGSPLVEGADHTADEEAQIEWPYGVLIAVCDGLTGFPEAINALWPEAKSETCRIHVFLSCPT